jgi:hypothetical protein
MKANEAPEKIYIPTILAANTVRYKEEGSIEYIRTDAFIDKADKFISSFFHPDDTELKKGILDEFHKYMKGE